MVMEWAGMSETRTYLVEKIFSCKRCGYCCQGKTTVSLDKDDQERMVHALGLPREVVAEKFLRITGSVVQMKTVDGHCIFYDPAGGCSVHEGRPWRCGQWPLHPSILSDEANFRTIRESCPGLNQEISYDEFCTVLKQLLEENDQMMI